MNITLSADEALIKKGREYAKSHNTSLNQLIRDHLTRLTGNFEPEKAASEFVSLAMTESGNSEDDFRFSREALYDRHNDL